MDLALEPVGLQSRLILGAAISAIGPGISDHVFDVDHQPQQLSVAASGRGDGRLTQMSHFGTFAVSKWDAAMLR